MKRKRRVAVAMSGGVDSSVTAKLLLDKGFEVVGVTGKMVNSEDTDLICDNAKKVCDNLGIDHEIIDATDLFQEKVVEYFINSYKKGITPNPCIACNQHIKWGIIFDYAINKMGMDNFATGHYADIRYQDRIYKLYPAKDAHKDQLYFLYRLGQNELSKTFFPLANYTKDEIRKIAMDSDLPSKSSKESQDICFIKKPCTTKKYLIEKLGNKKGDFVDINTKEKLGEHEGCYFYTIGQRKGIGIAAPQPLYVIDIDADKNIVYLGKNEDNFKSELIVSDLNLTYPIEEKQFDAMVKIRYNMKSVKANVKINSDNATINFHEPVSSITKGQAGVFYDMTDGHLIGGGVVV